MILSLIFLFAWWLVWSNGTGAISRREVRQIFRHLDIRASDDEIDVVVNQMELDGTVAKKNDKNAFFFYIEHLSHVTTN